MKELELKSDKLRTIEGIREFFANPHSERPSEMGRLAERAIFAMGQIYRTSGNLDLMDPYSKVWLRSSLQEDPVGNLEAVLGQVLYAETATRRFDEKFFGQIHPQGSEIGILSSLIAAYMNTNTIIKDVSIAENKMESDALGWFADLFGYDRREYSGNIVTGGTLANLAALWVAREHKINCLKKEGRWYPGMNLYVLSSNMAHYSLDKACMLLGTENVVLVKVSNVSFKTKAEELEKAIIGLDLENGAVMAVIGLAGETETGMVDDLNSLADVAEKYGAHFHADAAYGGPFILSKEGWRFNGINRADSITVDPHKMLYTPYAAGAVLFKDKTRHALIERSMRENAGYQAPEDIRRNMDSRVNFGFSRVEGSMGSGGVIATWATIRLLGREGIATLLNHTIDLTQHAYKRVEQSELLKPLHNPETNTLLIGLKPNLSPDLHKQIVYCAQKRVDTQKGYYISTDDKITGVPILRFVAMNPYSTTENVDELFDFLEKEIASQL